MPRRDDRIVHPALGTMAALVVLLAGPASAHGFKTVFDFNGGKVGIEPGQLTIDASGNLFGVTNGGAKRGLGTVFELLHAKTYKLIHTFCQRRDCSGGSFPIGPLVVDASGNIYGTTQRGGAQDQGTAFELVRSGTTWTFLKLHDFCVVGGTACTDGGPSGALAYAGQASGAPYDGTSPLYGLTSQGGAHGGGAAYRLAPGSGTWSYGVIYDFCALGGSDCTDGSFPQAALLVDGSGNLLGTTIAGGTNHPTGPGDGGGGTVFELQPGSGGVWSESVLYSFCARRHCADGVFPMSTPVEDASGNLYGTTKQGGAICTLYDADSAICGTVFKLALDGSQWQESVLHAFCPRQDCMDGASPNQTLAIDAAGDLFGTTELGGGNDTADLPDGGGAVFEIGNGKYSLLHRFCAQQGCADGYQPVVGVVIDGNGDVFGTTYAGSNLYEIKP